MPQLFLVYRHSDSAFITRQIADRLAGFVGAQNLITIAQDAPPNVDLRDDVYRLAQTSRVVLVIIGQAWAQDPRLQNPNDFNRIAIESALNNPQVRVLPVLVNGAMMPPVPMLPPTLQGLCYRGSTSVRDVPYFDQDMHALNDAIRRLLQTTASPTPPIAPQQPAPQPPVIIVRDSRFGCLNVIFNFFSSIIQFIGSLFATIIRAMLASVVNFVVGILLSVILGGLVIAFVMALFQTNFDIGMALGLMGQQVSDLIRGVIGQ